jgi:hypothetical protein
VRPAEPEAHDAAKSPTPCTACMKNGIRSLHHVHR